MAKQLQLRRGTTAQHSTFTGAVGEITVDTDKDVVVVHDGTTVGGFPLARADGIVATATTANALNTSNAYTGTSFNSITGLSSTTPIVAGTAAVGTATTAARADHVHPVQTTITGNAGTATKLATARTINGVSFDGSANITVADSTKVVANSAITAGTGTKITYDAKGLVTGSTTLSASDVPQLNQNTTGSSGSCTGNAATATKLATARTINGVSFDGTANITVADSTKVAKVTSTDNAIARYDGTGGAIQNSSVVIDDSGNVGIGTSSPSVKLDTKGLVRSSIGTGTGTGGAAYAFYQFGTSATATENWHIGTEGDGSFRFYNQGYEAGLEKMRIDSSGNLLVGTTSALYAYAGNSARWVGSNGGWMLSQDTTAVRNQIAFFNPNGNVGAINTTGSSTIYGTSSDYRLKENIQPMQNALVTVAQLNPVTYTWKVDGSDGQGFIAHELQAVVPDCVTGEKDAVDAEGNPIYQGIDTSFLVATLTKAIQELKAEVDDLKAQLEAK